MAHKKPRWKDGLGLLESIGREGAAERRKERDGQKNSYIQVKDKVVLLLPWKKIPLLGPGCLSSLTDVSPRASQSC